MSLSNFTGNQAAQILITVVVAIVVQIIARKSISGIVKRIIRSHKYASHSDEEKREKTLSTIFRTASAVIIWVIAGIVILSQLHVNIAALMTGAGLLGIVVGFGAQSSIQDFLAGLFIIAENQYRVGDIVTLRASGADYSGIVEDITVRITRLRDLDGNLHIIQNGSASVVSNLSFGYANVNIDIGVAYEADIDKVEKVMNQVGKTMKEDQEWGEMIVDPIHFLRLDSFADSAVVVKALGKVEPAKQWDVAGEYRRRLKVAFEKEGISIPFPQRVVHSAKK